MIHGHNFDRTFSGQAGECSDLKLKMGIIEEATDLLENKGLRTILEEYGTVLPTGSYALDLMTWRDLDLFYTLFPIACYRQISSVWVLK